MSGSTSGARARSSRSHHVARPAICALLTALALSGPHAAADPTIDAGLAWLRGQQNQQGSWAGESRLAVRDTSEVLRTLKSLVVDDPAIARGADALMGGVAPVTDFEARRLGVLRVVLGAGPVAPALAALAARQLADGGWSFAEGSEASSVVETALALRGLAGSTALSGKAISAGVTRLAAFSNADGGYAHTRGEPSDLATSAEALLAFNELSTVTNVEAYKSAVGGFLSAHINPDGGFPARPGLASDVTTTALVLNALLGSGLSLANVTPARDYLRAAHAGNGSWLDDPYTTALALAVVGAERADLMVSGLQPVPATVPQGTAVTVAVLIKNGGLAPSPSSEVALFAGDPSSGGTLLGTATAPALAVGGTASTSFSVATAGLSGAVVLHAVVDRAGTIPEYSELNNRQIVVLQVLPPGSAPPPSGNQPPIITSIPQTTAVAGQAFTYQIEAVDPEGGALEYGVIADSALGISVDPDLGFVTFTPAPATTLINAALTVRDPEGALTIQRLTVQVIVPGTKLPPRFDSAPTTPAQPAGLYSYTAVVHDPDGGPVTVTLAQRPAGMNFDPATATVSWTPAGTDVGEHPVRLVAVDDEGTATEQAWLVVVSKVDQGTNDLAVLSVDAATAIIDPQTLAATGTLLVKIANQGGTALSNVEVSAAEDRNADLKITRSDNLLGAVRWPSLAAGATVVVAVPLSGQALFRDNRLWGVVDLAGDFPEGREDNNDAPTGEDARLATVQGAFAPQIKLNWRGASDAETNQIQSAPMVAYLDDDNGDGHAGEGDVPSILFASQLTTTMPSTVPARVRGLNGRTGAVTFSSSQNVLAGVSPLIADLDGNGTPEIVTLDTTGHVVALKRDGSLFWQSASIPLPDAVGGPAGLAAADLDGDGHPEIIFGGRVLNADGSLKCAALTTPFNPMNVVVEDLDLDGVPEFVVGNIAYRANCAEYWNFQQLQSAQYFIASGQLDADPFPELVFSIRGQATFVAEHDGTKKWTLTGSTNVWGSVTALGDVDGDGASELVMVSGDRLRVVEPTGSERWSVALQDVTGLSSAATTADLDGDGRAEVIFSTFRDFYIFRGSDGFVLYRADSSNGTAWEYPTVADVDADGRLDIVTVLSFGSLGGRNTRDFTGIRVYADPRWAAGRSLWNQHQYGISNINCDQTVPRKVRPTWQVTAGSLLAGGEVPRALREQLGCQHGPSDLTASFLRVDRARCPAEIDYLVRVGNGGSLTVPAGAAVGWRSATGTGPLVPLATVTTTRALAPGEYEDVRVTVTSPPAGPQSVVAEIDPQALLADGRPGNNSHGFNPALCDVSNRAPLFDSTPVVAATVGRPYAYLPVASDPDADLVRFTLTTAPAAMALDAAGVVRWTPSAGQLGPHAVVLQGSDGHGGTAVQSFIVVVSAALPDEPPATPVPALRLTLVADAASYAPNASALLTAVVSNDQGTGRTGQLSIEVLDANRARVATILDAQPVLVATSASQTANALFAVGLHPPGIYTARAFYRELDGETSAETTFAVVGAAGLTGILITDRRAYGPSDDVTLTRTLRNTAPSGGLDGLEASVEVLDAQGQLLFAANEAPLTLGAGAVSLTSTQWPVNGRAPGAYRGRLTARRAGQVLLTTETSFEIRAAGELRGSLQAVPLSLESGATLNLTAALQNAGNAGVSLATTFALSDAASLTVHREQTGTITLAPTEGRDVVASMATAGLAPGTYLATFEGSSGGIRLIALAVTVTVVANQPPVVVVQVPSCTADPVTPVITISDASPVTVTKSLDGQPYTAGPVTAEGSHILVVTAVDAGGASTTKSVSFIVDRTAPALSVSGVNDAAFYAGPVAATISVSDANLVSFSATLDGEVYQSEAPIATEGAHLLAVSAIDCAGNLAHFDPQFVLDLTAPQIAIVAPACSATPVTPQITVVEANPAQDVRLLDGQTYAGGPVAAAGNHTLSVTVTDRASHVTAQSAGFIVDTTAPTINVTGVTNGGHYTTSVTPVFAASEPNLTSLTAQLNGAAFVSGTAITAPGAYVLVVTARDCAGNQTSTSVSFEVATSPTTGGELSHELGGRARVLIGSECVGCPPAPSLLRTTLESAGVFYEQAATRNEWQAKLRSGRFNVVVLYRPAPSESGTAFKELNEAVWMGDALIFIKNQSDAMPNLREALGADFGGGQPHASSVTLTTPLRPVSLPLSGGAVTLQLQGATGIGRSGGPTGPVIATSNGRGLGKAITLAWDTETSASGELYLSALEAAAPAADAPLLAGGIADVKVTARNTGPSMASFLIAHTLGTGLSTSEPSSRTLNISAGGNQSFFLPLRLGSSPGPFSLTGTLAVGGQQLDTDVFTFNVPRTRSAIGADLEAALNALTLTGSQAALRSQAVGQVQAAAAAATPTAAIGNVLTAIDKVRGITAVDVTAIRIDLARLLRSYQVAVLP
jgi:hypothetical protein